MSVADQAAAAVIPLAVGALAGPGSDRPLAERIESAQRAAVTYQSLRLPLAAAAVVVGFVVVRRVVR